MFKHLHLTHQDKKVVAKLFILSSQLITSILILRTHGFPNKKILKNKISDQKFEIFEKILKFFLQAQRKKKLLAKFFILARQLMTVILHIRSPMFPEKISKKKIAQQKKRSPMIFYPFCRYQYVATRIPNLTKTPLHAIQLSISISVARLPLTIKSENSGALSKKS